MTTLANRFDLSDVALKKTCRRHYIPTPPLGWWAKKAAGKKVSQTPLPRGKTSEVRNVVIRHGQRSSLRENLERAREVAEQLVEPVAAKHAQQDIVGRTMTRVRKAKIAPAGIATIETSGAFATSIGPASFDRLEAFLNQLVTAVAIRGWNIRSVANGVAIETADEAITLGVSEIVERTKHVPTEAELEKLRRWEEKQARDARLHRWSFTFDRPSIPDWDHVPSARLQVQLEQVYVIGGTAPRRTFADGKTQTIEGMLPEIIVGIAATAIAKREHEEWLERQRREWKEREERRRDAEREAALRARRIAFLDEVFATAERLERVDHLQQLLDQSELPGRRAGVFREWLRQYSDELRASISSAGIDQRLELSGAFNVQGNQAEIGASS
ncbi:MAG TPA: hypothetical protein VH207_02390 [Chthoniobacterales bacterium]|nr:hypothetical protein [Chthoniobacterales bacterium]